LAQHLKHDDIVDSVHSHVKRQIATAPGAALFSSPVFIGIVVAAGVFFLLFGLITLYFYLKRKKSLAAGANAADRPSGEATALEDMKSAVYDPHTSALNGNSDVFNPMPLENSAVHQPLGEQYQKLPIASGDTNASGGASSGAAPSNVTDEEYGELELFKNAEQGGGATADVSRDGYGIISKALIKPTEEKLLKPKKSKTKVKFDTVAITAANHEYGAPNLPVVGQYSNTPATEEETAAYEANQTMAISPETVMLARPVKGKAAAAADDDDAEVAESRAAMATKKKSSKGKMRAKDSKSGKSLQSFKSAKSGRRGDGTDDGAEPGDEGGDDDEKPTLGSGKSQSLPSIDL
jgi:hypothetical protein